MQYTNEQLSRALENAKRQGNMEAVRHISALLAKQSPFEQPNESAGIREAKARALLGGDTEGGPIGNLARGLATGAVGTGESIALGLAALAPGVSDETEDKFRENVQKVTSRLKPTTGQDSALYKLGTGLGSIGTFAIPGVGAAKLAGTLGLGTKGVKAAALGTTGTAGVGAGAGEASERARAGGATREERQAATLRGGAIGITEILPLGRIFKDLEIPILKDLKEVVGPEELQRFRDRVGNAVLTGGYEAGQEATAAILQNLNERGYNAERALLDLGVAEEAAIGGSAGAVLQFFTDLFYRGSGRKIGEQRPEKDPSVTVKRPEDDKPPGDDSKEDTEKQVKEKDKVATDPEQLSLFEGDL